jgi:hypothetical protein
MHTIKSLAPVFSSNRAATGVLAPLLPEKTWTNFQTHFTTAWQDLQDDNLLTSQNQGYNPTNMLEQQQVTFTNDTAEAFANLASATTADCSTLAALVATSKDLTNQLATKDKIINDLRLALSNSNNNNANTNRRNPRSQHGGGLPNNKNYCWTHGYVIADDHTTSCTVRPSAPPPIPTTNERPLELTSWVLAASEVRITSQLDSLGQLPSCVTT